MMQGLLSQRGTFNISKLYDPVRARPDFNDALRTKFLLHRQRWFSDTIWICPQCLTLFFLLINVKHFIPDRGIQSTR